MSDISGELDRTLDLLLGSAHDLTNRMADKQKALDQAHDLQRRVAALIKLIEQAPGPLMNLPEDAVVQVREFTNQTMVLRDYVKDGRPVQDRTNRLVNLSYTLSTLTDPIGAGSIRNVKQVVHSIRQVGDFVRGLQPNTLSKTKSQVLGAVYDTLLETLGWMGRAKLENDERSQVLLTAAMSAYQSGMNSALSDKTESMHNPAPGGKRKVNGKPRGRGAISAMTAPAPPLQPLTKDVSAPLPQGTVAPLQITSFVPNPSRGIKKEQVQQAGDDDNLYLDDDDIPMPKRTVQKIKIKQEPVVDETKKEKNNKKENVKQRVLQFDCEDD